MASEEPCSLAKAFSIKATCDQGFKLLNFSFVIVDLSISKKALNGLVGTVQFGKGLLDQSNL
jgi:hypothetical protein